MINTVIEQAKLYVDRPIATLLVTSDPKKKWFVPEAVVVGVILFLLQRYCTGFLKGLGFDEAAERHGKKAAELLSKLRSTAVTDIELDQAKKEVEAAIQEVRGKVVSESAKSEAVSCVKDAILDAGAVPEQARDVAGALSHIVLGD